MFPRDTERRAKRSRDSFNRARETKDSPFLPFPAGRIELTTYQARVTVRKRRVARRDLIDAVELIHVVHALRQYVHHPKYPAIYARCTEGFNPDTLRFVEHMQDIVEETEAE